MPPLGIRCFAASDEPFPAPPRRRDKRLVSGPGNPSRHTREQHVPPGGCSRHARPSPAPCRHPPSPRPRACGPGCAARRRGAGRCARRAGLRQVDVAERAGISQPFYSRLERGLGTSVSLETLAAGARRSATSSRRSSSWPRAPRRPRRRAPAEAAAGHRHRDRRGWRAVPEAALPDDGPRPRSIDVLLRAPARGETAVVEVVDLLPTSGTPSEPGGKVLAIASREPGGTVAGLLLVRRTRRNRQVVSDLRSLFAARYPGRRRRGSSLAGPDGADAGGRGLRLDERPGRPADRRAPGVDTAAPRAWGSRWSVEGVTAPVWDCAHGSDDAPPAPPRRGAKSRRARPPRRRGAEPRLSRPRTRPPGNRPFGAGRRRRRPTWRLPAPRPARAHRPQSREPEDGRLDPAHATRDARLAPGGSLGASEPSRSRGPRSMRQSVAVTRSQIAAAG